MMVFAGARDCLCMNFGICKCMNASNEVIWFDGSDRESDIDADFSTDDDSRLCYLNTIKSYILVNFAYRLLQYMTLASNRGVGRVHTTHSYCVVPS